MTDETRREPDPKRNAKTVAQASSQTPLDVQQRRNDGTDMGHRLAVQHRLSANAVLLEGVLASSSGRTILEEHWFIELGRRLRDSL